MLTNKLQPKILKWDSSKFLRSMKGWVDPEKDVFLIDCNFDLEFFDVSLFGKLSISYPHTIKRSVPKRQAEFLAGRYAALHALKLLGLDTQLHVGIGPNREPLWPTGIVGSISHNNNRAICIVGKRQHVSILGIDIEDTLSPCMADEIRGEIYNFNELDIFSDSMIPEPLATTIIFSAKESLFKALYPSVKTYFGFQCARLVHIDLINQVLTFKLATNFATKFKLKSKYQVYFQYDLNVAITVIMQQF